METSLLSAGQVMDCVEQIAAIYRAAFAAPPYNRQEHEVAEFARALPLHIGRDGFRCAAVLDEEAGSMIGFAYGYRSQRGQWWHENVSRALGNSVAALWLADAFQVAEVAVIPAHQGCGHGAALHSLLLATLPHGRAVLSTLDAETPGRQLYRTRGWQELLTSFHFPGVARPYAIMGRILRNDFTS